MICELYKFCGLLPLEFSDYQTACKIVLNGEEKEIFESFLKIFIESEFIISCPLGLTPFEASMYHIAKIEHKLNEYKKQAIIFKEILNADSKINYEDILREDNGEQAVLDKIARMALSE